MDQIFITNPQELKDVIKLYDESKDNDKINIIIYSIFKYKWYNWYQNIHIKEGSPADIENTKIFEDLLLTHPVLDELVESLITNEIERLNQDRLN